MSRCISSCEVCPFPCFVYSSILWHLRLNGLLTILTKIWLIALCNETGQSPDLDIWISGKLLLLLLEINPQLLAKISTFYFILIYFFISITFFIVFALGASFSSWSPTPHLINPISIQESINIILSHVSSIQNRWR